MIKRMMLAAFAVGLVAVAACSKNEAATSKCNTSTSSETCETCCKANGATGYTYSSNCGCLGGT